MGSKINADKINDYVRTFYGKGNKSDNKSYVGVPEVEIDPEKVERRSKNQILSNQQRVEFHEYLGKLRNIGKSPSTPAQVGEIIVNQKIRSGNCAEMSRVACYVAARSKVAIWFVTIEDPGDHQFCLFVDAKPTYTSIEAMDGRSDTEWIIDPWANIVCQPCDYKDRFTDKMKKWQTRGKNIAVLNESKDKLNWTPPLDPDYLSAILTSTLTYKHGFL